MNINYKQSQFELFPSSSGSSSDASKPRYLFANLTLSIENIVVIGIVTLMVMVIAFSLGVEKGKKISNESLGGDQRMSAHSNNTSRQVSGAVHRDKQDVPLLEFSGNEAVQTQESQRAAKFDTSKGELITDPQVSSPEEESKILSQQSVPIQSVHKKNLSAVMPLDAGSQVVEKKPYTIQVASFKGDQYAQKEASELKNQKLDAFVISKGDFSIVCVGRFSKKEEANKLLSKLKKTYNDCLLRRL